MRNKFFFNIFKKQEVELTAADYLKGIKDNDSSVLRKIYKLFLPMIVDFVKKNNGTESEARDIFQDGLIVIYKKVKNDELVLTSSFQTYLFSVCRFIWLRELKKKHRTEASLESVAEPVKVDNLEEQWLDTQKEDLFKSKLLELPPDAQKVLQLFFNKVSLSDIASEMGYTEAYAKKKKYKAKEKLIQLIQADKNYLHLIEKE